MPRDGFSRKYGKAELASSDASGQGGAASHHARDKVFCGDTILSMNAFWNFFQTLLGLSLQPKDLTFVQISLRGIIIFLATLIMVRLGSKRSLARRTPFDAILLVILAAVLSRAINGSAPFLATIGGGAVLVALHRLFALLAFHSHSFGILVKGKPDVIVRDGQCDFPTMRSNHVSIHDLEEDMRLNAHLDEVAQVRLACLERSGEISFIQKKII
jgi:uncharacterized membrane protein YcaP (DUF421 family)